MTHSGGRHYSEIPFAPRGPQELSGYGLFVKCVFEGAGCGGTRARSNGRVACRVGMLMPTLGHARYTQDSHVRRLCAGELSRGVGLRGFESHSPHQTTNPLVSLSELAAFGFWMQKQGYRPSTIQGCIKSLKPIARQTNLLDPEAVKSYLAKASVSENTKDRYTQDLTRFYKYKGITWTAPRYRRVEKLPFIPTETEVAQLISGLGPKTACFLQILQETGMRAGEAWNLKWVDIDFERGTVNVTPEKGSRPRQLKISNRTLAMLNSSKRLWVYVFRNPAVNPLKSLDGFRRNFELSRVNVALKLQNPRIKSISFKTLRHYKATMEYHRTKDILHVMQLLGHKNIRNTLVYTHLVNWQNDEYVCKVAKTVDEAKALITDGFDYVTDVDNYKLFRKRK